MRASLGTTVWLNMKDRLQVRTKRQQTGQMHAEEEYSAGDKCVLNIRVRQARARTRPGRCHGRLVPQARGDSRQPTAVCYHAAEAGYFRQNLYLSSTVPWLNKAQALSLSSFPNGKELGTV